MLTLNKQGKGWRLSKIMTASIGTNSGSASQTGTTRVIILTTEEEESKKLDYNHY